MKNILTILLVFTLSFSVVSCGNKPSSNNDTPTQVGPGGGGGSLEPADDLDGIVPPSEEKEIQ